MVPINLYYMSYFVVLFLWLFIPGFNRHEWKRRLLLTLIFTAVFAADVLLISIYSDKIADSIRRFLHLYPTVWQLIEVISRCTIHLLFLSFFYILDRKCRWTDALLLASVLIICRECSETLEYFLQFLLHPWIRLSASSDIINSLFTYLTAAVGIFVLVKFVNDEQLTASKDAKYVTAISIGSAYFAVELVSVFLRTEDLVLALFSFSLPVMFLYLLNQKVILRHYVAENAQLIISRNYLVSKFDTITDYSNELSKIQHDMLHHLHQISLFINHEDYASARSYLAKLENDPVDFQYQTVCHNMYLNSILYYYRKSFPGLHIHYESALSPVTDKDDLDIALIIFVLLEAYIFMKNEGDFHLQIIQKGDNIFISISCTDITSAPKLTETQLSILNHSLAKFDRIIEQFVPLPGDTSICLKCKPLLQ